MFGFTTARSLERASTMATLHRLEMERDHARRVLAELVQALDTAPGATFLGSHAYPLKTRQDFAAGTKTIRVEAPHKTWEPISNALEKARRVLGGGW